MLVPIRTDMMNFLFSSPLKLLMKNLKFILVIDLRKKIDPNNLISVVEIGFKSLSNKTIRDKRAAKTAHKTEKNE